MFRGPEACAAFRAGLKPGVLELALVMKEASARHEMSSVEAVVKAAQEAESLMSLLAGVSSMGKEKLVEREEGDIPQVRGKHGNGQSRRAKYYNNMFDTQRRYGLHKRGGKHDAPPKENVCHECLRNSAGHFAFKCLVQKAQLAAATKNNSGAGPSKY